MLPGANSVRWTALTRVSSKRFAGLATCRPQEVIAGVGAAVTAGVPDTVTGKAIFVPLGHATRGERLGAERDPAGNCEVDRGGAVGDRDRADLDTTDRDRQSGVGR